MTESLCPDTPVDPAPDGRRRLIFWGIAITLVLVWGTAFTMIGYSVRYVSPVWLVSTRVMLGAVLMTAYMYARGRRFPALTDIRWLWYSALGFTGMVAPFFLISWGQKTIDSGLSAVIVGTMPLMTIILAHFFANERMTLFKGLGFLMGFVGIAVLFLPDDIDLGLISDWRGQACMVLGAFCYALTTVAAKRAPDTPSSTGAAMMLTAAAVMALAASLPFALAVNGGGIDSIPLSAWLCIIGLGIGSTALGTILYLYMIAEFGPSSIARINYFPPLVSVIAGIIFLSEDFTLKLLIALALIFAGLLLAGVKRKPAISP